MKFNKQKVIKVLPFLMFGYFFDKLSQAFQMSVGANIGAQIMNTVGNIGTAFQNPLPSFNPIDLLVGAAGGVIVKLIIYVKGKNAKKYRKGCEYGSARWGNAEDIKPYTADRFEDNVILTETERLTMESRPKAGAKFSRNKNILVIGGSGSGKTRFFVKPNLLQMHSSYVVTDPKGTVLLEVGNALEHGGYSIKVLNTINFAKSMHYNPLAYIRSEKDILKLVNTIIANTNVDVLSMYLQFKSGLDAMDIGELFLLMIEALIVSLAVKAIAVLVTVVLVSRMIEIYLYCSIAPIPFATMTNREWGNTGTNYIRSLVALAFQAFFIMVIVGIYAALVKGLADATDLHGMLLKIGAYSIILCMSLFKTSSISKSIFNAH